MPIMSRGHLNPGSPDVVFDRFGLDLDDLVRHVWVVRWDLPPGEVRHQRVLTYPAFNVVFEPADVAVHPPRRSVVVRELRGRSWGVGILLRPAATRLLVPGPAGSPGPDPVPVVDAPLAAVAEAVAGPHGPDTDHLVAILTRWLEPFADGVDDVGRMVNRACQLAEERSDLHRVEDLAREVGTTVRTLHRLVTRATGLSPKWLLECRRLQVAATTLYTTPEVDLAILAAELGFVDQSHFTRRYGEVLGETPDDTRRAGRAARAAPASRRRADAAP